jgi:hypothetical protein
VNALDDASTVLIASAEQPATERIRLAGTASVSRPISGVLRVLPVARAGVPKLIFSVIRAPSASATFCIRSTPTPG